MMIWLIAGGALAVLGVLLFLVLQMPEVMQKKRKKKNEPPPEPPKDWKAIAERMEKRLQTQDRALGSAQDELKGRDKKLAELNASVGEMKMQLDQEKVWREKGEALVAKEKKQERLLQEELEKTRADLNRESTLRIKQEYELKELRQAREELAAQVRKLSSEGMQLQRSLVEAQKENKDFRAENFELKKKKEDEEWVAKSDYKRLESFLKRARWEVEQFKKKVPAAEWPKALQPKPAASSSVAVISQESSAASAPKAAETPDRLADMASAAPETEQNSSSQGV